MCVRLFQEHGIAVATGDGFQIRAFDATTVKEPGKTGALWRIHYSVCLPSLACDSSSSRVRRGRVPANRWRSSRFAMAIMCWPTGALDARGIGHVAAAGGQLIVRVNTGALLLRTLSGEPFDLLAAVTPLRRAGVAKSWSAQVVVGGDTAPPSRAVRAVSVPCASLRRPSSWPTAKSVRRQPARASSRNRTP